MTIDAFQFCVFMFFFQQYGTVINITVVVVCKELVANTPVQGMVTTELTTPVSHVKERVVLGWAWHQQRLVATMTFTCNVTPSCGKIVTKKSSVNIFIFESILHSNKVYIIVCSLLPGGNKLSCWEPCGSQREPKGL